MVSFLKGYERSKIVFWIGLAEKGVGKIQTRIMGAMKEFIFRFLVSPMLFSFYSVILSSVLLLGRGSDVK